jgi:hypothetical protein
VIPVAAAIRQHGASRGRRRPSCIHTADGRRQHSRYLGPPGAVPGVGTRDRAFVSGILAGLLVQVFGRDVPAEAKAGTPARKGGCCGGATIAAG